MRFHIFVEMDKLFEYYHKLIDELKFGYHRYLYKKINWNNRMIGLTGPRGVGKTTMLLQYIKEHLPLQQSLYVTVEDFYFADNKILDLADAFTKMGGKYLIIDEVHKYADWSKELKLIYDYHPELKIIFTGSSLLDIKKGASDLSRRAVMYRMQGLSFREYLQLFQNIDVKTFTLDQVLEHNVKTPVSHPLLLFADYLKRGYYPFAAEDDLDIRLQQIINQTLETDIPQYAGMNVSTGRKLKQFLAIISQSVPFKPNFSKIADMLAASRNNIADYCFYMEEAGLIAQLRDDTGGIRGLGKVDKIYLDNTNLIYSLATNTPDKGNIRETFFLNQLKAVTKIVASAEADFLVNDITFEVGGKTKKQKQITTVKNGFIVKDDIEYGFANTIPLWQMGLLY